MNRLLVLLPILFLLTACGATTSPEQVRMGIQATQAPRVTASPIPTPTIGYQATADVASTQAAEAYATAEAANLIVAAYTAQAEQINHDNLVIEQERLAWTAQADQWTATYAPTSIPLTATAQANNDMRDKTAVVLYTTYMTATHEAPTQVIAYAKAQAEAKNAERYVAAEIWIWISVGVLLCGLGAFGISGSAIAVIRKVMEARAQISVPETEPAPILPADYLPFKATADGPNSLRRYEVKCTPKQLHAFAIGVRLDRMTLAFNQWEGTTVHKSLKDIRAFLVEWKYARVIIGKGGDLDLTEDGEEFLDDVIAHKGPPPPLVCIENDPPVVSHA